MYPQKQVATLLTLYEWVDWIGIGIWGGCFMISAGSLTIQRRYDFSIRPSLNSFWIWILFI